MFAKPLLEKQGMFLPLNLQFFAKEDEDDSEEDEEDDSDDEDGPDLDELLKDPKFKKKYQAKLKEQLSKRMKKFADVDPEEYRLLKEKADKNKKKADEEEDDKESLQSELKAKEQKLLRAERREKRFAVKEFAVDNGYDQKLLARLIDIDAVELDEDGEPENLEDLFDELKDEFPQYFGDQDEDDDEEDTEPKKKSYRPGSKQKGNKKREKDKRAAGAERAKQRHKKEE